MDRSTDKINLRICLSLIGINFIYACVSIFTKMASSQTFLSPQWIAWIVGALGVMGLYALCWQQVLKRTGLSTAYMFKGTSLIFILLISTLLFGETITLKNIIGSAIIIVGIVLYARV